MKSFEIEHMQLKPGIYKHSVSGLITTWDVRLKVPNSGNYMTPNIIHSLEHTLASYLRNRYDNYRIVGIFPMGCQTGFYILTRFFGKVEIFNAIVDYVMDLQMTKEVPGVSARQCGQYRLHDLIGAQRTMLEFYEHYLKYNHAASNYQKQKGY